MLEFDTQINAAQHLLKSALLNVDRVKVTQLLSQPLLGHDILQWIEEMVTPVLREIGEGWQNGDYSLSQVYMSGRICEEMVEHFLTITDIPRRSQPPIAIVSLEDYHLLGQRMVYSAMCASGFTLLNYGRKSVEELCLLVQKDQLKILLISVLMFPSALKVKSLHQHLLDAGLAVKLVVGGAPFRFDAALWQEVGADACGHTAADAATITKQLLAAAQ